MSEKPIVYCLHNHDGLWGECVCAGHELKRGDSIGMFVEESAYLALAERLALAEKVIEAAEQVLSVNECPEKVKHFGSHYEAYDVLGIALAVYRSASEREGKS